MVLQPPGIMQLIASFLFSDKLAFCTQPILMGAEKPSTTTRRENHMSSYFNFTVYSPDCRQKRTILIEDTNQDGWLNSRDYQGNPEWENLVERAKQLAILFSRRSKQQWNHGQLLFSMCGSKHLFTLKEIEKMAAGNWYDHTPTRGPGCVNWAGLKRVAARRQCKATVIKPAKTTRRSVFFNAGVLAKSYWGRRSLGVGGEAFLGVRTLLNKSSSLRINVNMAATANVGDQQGNARQMAELNAKFRLGSLFSLSSMLLAGLSVGGGIAVLFAKRGYEAQPTASTERVTWVAPTVDVGSSLAVKLSNYVMLRFILGYEYVGRAKELAPDHRATVKLGVHF